MSHEQLVAACFQWHWNNFPEERKMLYAVNNNSYNRIEGNKNKAKGVVAGVLDFCYLSPSGAVVFLDAKVGSDSLSADQRDFITKAQGRGHPCFTFKSLEEFQNIIKQCQT